METKFVRRFEICIILIIFMTMLFFLSLLALAISSLHKYKTLNSLIHIANLIAFDLEYYMTLVRRNEIYRNYHELDLH